MPRINQPSRNRQAIHATQDRALHLRTTTNLTLREIARECGYINPVTGEPRPSTAVEAIRSARARSGQTAQTTANTAVAQVASRASVVGGIPSNRTFGFEAEFFGIRPQVALNALAAVGISARYAGRLEQVSGWKLTTDGSVTSTGTGTSGLELVSPPLQGVAGLELAHKAVEAIASAGGKVDKSCGLHVHVGMDGLVGSQLMKIVDLYASNWSNIKKLVANSRHSNYFCKELTPSVRNRIEQVGLRNATTASTTSSLRRETSTIDRFYAVNLAAYSKHGTVEFRQHQGTLNGKKLNAWICLMLAMVEQATAGNTQGYADVNAMLGAMNLDEATAGYLNNRVAQLAN